jgi:hypothetical protein
LEPSSLAPPLRILGRPRIEDEEIDLSRGEEEAGHGQPLLAGSRSEEDEPVQTNASRHRIEGIEAP